MEAVGRKRKGEPALSNFHGPPDRAGQDMRHHSRLAEPTARSPWKTSPAGSSASSPTNFNGATARRPWKTGTPAIRASLPRLLQWSHGQEAVENGERISWPTVDDTTLQWSHGQEAVENCGRRCDHAARRLDFSGATARRPWKTQIVQLQPLSDPVASMEPRPGGCGKPDREDPRLRPPRTSRVKRPTPATSRRSSLARARRA